MTAIQALAERVAKLESAMGVSCTEPAPEPPAEPAGLLEVRPLSAATAQFQRALIERAIFEAANMSDAAELLGLHRSNLYRKMRQLEMPTTEVVDA